MGGNMITFGGSEGH